MLPLKFALHQLPRLVAATLTSLVSVLACTALFSSHSAFCEVDDQELVLFMDAFDTMLFGDSGEIATKFLSMDCPPGLPEAGGVGTWRRAYGGQLMLAARIGSPRTISSVVSFALALLASRTSFSFLGVFRLCGAVPVALAQRSSALCVPLRVVACLRPGWT